MSFGFKNGPPIYQRVMGRTFKKYFKKMMKIFLDDFVVCYMDTHLAKHRLCFLKCRKFGISLNPNKCAFMVFLGIILGLIVPKGVNH
jgi:hypothetical protein